MLAGLSRFRIAEPASPVTFLEGVSELEIVALWRRWLLSSGRSVGNTIQEGEQDAVGSDRAGGSKTSNASS